MHNHTNFVGISGKSQKVGGEEPVKPWDWPVFERKSLIVYQTRSHGFDENPHAFGFNSHGFKRFSHIV